MPVPNTLLAVLLAAAAAPAMAAGPAPSVAATPAGGAVDTPDIVVTARKLDAARDAILPDLGASKYSFDRAALDTQPGGQDRGLSQVLLQAPGVDQDGDGEIHVRNEHGNLQYRINGVIIPESIGGFGQTIDTRVADSIALLTGTLPAQYGYRTAGVVNITTQSGKFDLDGDIDFYGGSRGRIEPSFTLKDATGGLNYFVSFSYLQNDLGIENPTPSANAIHDRTEQYRGFVYLSQVLSDTSRLTAFGGSAIGRFQIPNNPGQTPVFTVDGQSTFDSALLDQTQREYTHYGVIAYQLSADPVSVQVAPFIRYSRTQFSPDPSGGDILFNGFSDASRLSSLAYGVQADASYTASAHHKVRGGLFFQNERTRSRVTSRVLPVAADGVPTSDIPFTIVSAQGKAGQLYGVYLQDEWTLTPTLTLNYGARFDAVHAYTVENQLSPRVNLVWMPSKVTTVHAGYARDFTPPPQELIGATTVAQFAGTTKAADPVSSASIGAVRAEREHYFDAGVLQTVIPGLTVGLDAYYKIKRNLLDEGQFGEAQILSPFNYARGWAWGVELTTAYHAGRWTLYGNAARGQEKGRDIVSSQFFFAPDELAYIAAHPIFTDHSQFWTASAGASLSIDDGLGKLTPTVDALYGDGLRRADPAGIVPNGGKLPAYATVNLGIAQAIEHGVLKGITVRFDVTNLFDASYELRDGSGVGVGAPQYGARRGFFGGIRRSF
ncbi:MAG: TonB-dependent receptor [Sphingomonadaceae bacterium]|nr:TonB-dependent receptor [Sphingomonadaceae bacterium]